MIEAQNLIDIQETKITQFKEVLRGQIVVYKSYKMR